MTSDDRFCLRWNNHQSHLSSVLENFLTDQVFVDVTLACDGRKFPAHRVILSACSPYFRDLLKENHSQHTIVVLRDVSHHHVTAMLQFIYHGEVRVAQEQLADFLKTAESLHIQGLTDQEGSNEAKEMPNPATNGMYNNGSYKSKEMRTSESNGPTLLSSHDSDNPNGQLTKYQASQKRTRLLDIEQTYNFPKQQNVILPEEKNAYVKEEDLEIVDDTDSDLTIYNGDSSDLITDAGNIKLDYWTRTEEATVFQNSQQSNYSQKPLTPQRTSVKLRSDLLAPNPIDPLAKAKARGFQLRVSPIAAQSPSLQALVNNKPCVCNMCGRRFCYRNQLTEHKKIAHHLDS